MVKVIFVLGKDREVRRMLKRKFETSSFEELIKKNKEEILKDKVELEKIEKRLDDKRFAMLK